MLLQFERRTGGSAALSAAATSLAGAGGLSSGSGMLTVDCWVDISKLDAENPVQEVCKRGFHMPSDGQGLPFTTGNIRFALDGPSSHQFLLCTVAVGRSFVVDDPNAKREIPKSAAGAVGYDSLYMHNPEEQLSASAVALTSDGSLAVEEGGPESYRHTYVVFDAAQVLPRYVVHFGYHPAERFNRQPVQAVNLAEIKAQVAAALSLLGPAAPAVTDKMLSDIGATYEVSMSQSQEPDPLLEERKRAIKDTLRAIDDKLKTVQTNSATVEEALYQKLQDALQQLQTETQKKLNLLLSEELELRRQLQLIEWTDSFVPVMQQSLPPMSFIAAWEKHAAIRSALYSQIPNAAGVSVRVLEEVQPDMRLVGHLEVVTEKSAMAAAGTMSVQSAQTAAGARFFGLPQQSNNAAAVMTAPATPNVMLTSSSSSAAAVPVVSVTSYPTGSSTSTNATSADQTSAELALARANLAAVEAASAHLPLQFRAQSDLARAEAEIRVREAEARVKSTNNNNCNNNNNNEMIVLSSNSNASPAGNSRSVTPAAAITTNNVISSGIAPAATPSTSANNNMTNSLTAKAPVGSNPEDRLQRFSIKREADRRRRQLSTTSGNSDSLLIGPSLAFQGSSIITPVDAKELYMCLPEATGDEAIAGHSPATTLLYSSAALGGGTLSAFSEAFQASGFNGATVILIKANGQVFGGYAADAWEFNGAFGGSPRSFLFSVTKDCKIPYHGRVRGPWQPTDDLMREQHEQYQLQLQNQYMAQYNSTAQLLGREPDFDEQGRLISYQYGENGQLVPVAVPVPRSKPFVRHDALKSTSDSLQFGIRDLFIRGDLAEGSSELECSYGIGLKPSSAESKSFLAGSSVFAIEAIEIWGITSRMPVEGEGDLIQN